MSDCERIGDGRKAHVGYIIKHTKKPNTVASMSVGFPLSKM